MFGRRLLSVCAPRVVVQSVRRNSTLTARATAIGNKLFGSIKTPSVPTRPFPDEAPEPVVNTTAIPGPKSKALYSAMDQLQDSRTTHFFADYQRSKGNYVGTCVRVCWCIISLVCCVGR